jgi:hypothetical protein
MRSTVLFAALLAALACGGSDKPDPACEPIACGDSCGSVPDGCGGTLACDACFVPPIVDPTRLGVACPAPDVPIAVTMDYDVRPVREYAIPASALVDGQIIYGVSTGLVGLPDIRVETATVVHDQPRIRVVLEDGRTPIFTPDHPLLVMGVCSTSEIPEEIGGEHAFAWVEVQYLRPGWCLEGIHKGLVQTIESAPDGDVIRIEIDQSSGTYGDLTGIGFGYFADGLMSPGHNLPIAP